MSNHNPKLGNNPTSSSSSNLRLALAFVFGIGTGVGVTKYLSDNPEAQKAPEMTDVQKANSYPKSEGQAASGDESLWPPNLVSARCFDKNPLDYVDVGQCRELIFRVTGGPVAVGEEEVLQECADIQERREMKRREEVADRIINEEFCLTDEEDIRRVRDLTSRGFTEYDGASIQGRALFLKNEDGKMEMVQFKRRPVCGLATVRQSFEAKQYDQVVNSLNIDALEESIRGFGLEEEFSSGLNALKEFQRLLPAARDPRERSEMACQFLQIYKDPYSIILDIKMKNDRWDDNTLKEAKGVLADSQILKLIHWSARKMLTDEDYQRCVGEERPSYDQP